MRRERATGSGAIDQDDNRRRILEAYRAGQRRMRRYRLTAETPSEFAQRVGRAEWDEITLAAEQAAYRPAVPALSLAEQVQPPDQQLRA